eukprot:gene5627-7002_t
MNTNNLEEQQENVTHTTYIIPPLNNNNNNNEEQQNLDINNNNYNNNKIYNSIIEISEFGNYVRVSKEYQMALKEIEEEKEFQQFLIYVNEDDVLDWRVVMRGPPNTLYENGVWVLSVNFPKNYPFNPPRIKFMNKIYHWSVDESSGQVFEAFISTQNWSPSLNIYKVLLSVSAILGYREPPTHESHNEFCQIVTDRAKADLFFHDHNEFINRVCNYINLFAINQVLSIAPEEEALLMNLRTLFRLESIYPEPIDFCSQPQYIACNSKPSVISIDLKGDGEIVVNGNDFKFVNLTKLYLTDVKVDSNDFLKVLNTTTNNIELRLIRSTITSIPFDRYSPNNMLRFKELTLIDNPIEGNIEKDTFSSIRNLTIFATNETFMKELHIVNTKLFTPLPFKVLPTVTNIYLSSFPNFTEVSSFSKLSIYLGPNFNVSTFKNIEDLKVLSEQSILSEIHDIKSIKTQVDFPVSFVSKNSNFESFNVDFNPLADPINASNWRFQFLGINGSPRFMSNFPFNSFPRLVQSLNFKYNQLTTIPDWRVFENHIHLISVNFNFNNITELPSLVTPIIISLHNNSLRGPLTQNQCTGFYEFQNNHMNGDLPQCYICGLYNPYFRPYLKGNNFTNYKESDTSFPPCTGIKITSVSKIIVGGVIRIDGENFGWDVGSIFAEPPILSFYLTKYNTRLESFPVSEFQFQKLKDIGFKFKLNFTYPNIILDVQGEIGDMGISNITFYPYYNIGYSFFIQGQGFSSNLTKLIITMGDFICKPYLTTVTTIECIIYQSIIAEDIYPFEVSNLLLDKKVTIDYSFTRRFPFISAVKPPKTTGGFVELFGSFGDIYDNSTVYIGSENCTIHSINNTDIICMIGPGSGVKDIKLTVNSVVWFQPKGFLYIDETSCPSCSDHGVCDIQMGKCICNENWGGPNCDLIKELPGTIRNNQTVTEITHNNITFGFKLQSIREVNVYGELVREIFFGDNWKTLSKTTTTSTYIFNFETCNITYTIEEIVGKSKDFEFAGEKMVLDPGAIKFTVEIENWRYLGSINTLQLQLHSFVYSSLPQTDRCGRTITQPTNITTINDSSSKSLQYITIERNNQILYGRFIDKVMSDGRPTFSSTKIHKLANDSVEVSIELPYCKQCIIDPDFSLLVKTKSGSNNESDEDCDGGNDKGNPNWLLPAIIIPSVIGSFKLDFNEKNHKEDDSRNSKEVEEQMKIYKLIESTNTKLLNYSETLKKLLLDGDTDNEYKYTIDNKYYTSTIDLLLLDLEHHGGGTSSEHHQKHIDNVVECNVELVVLVFDRNVNHSFKTVQSFANSLMEHENNNVSNIILIDTYTSSSSGGSDADKLDIESLEEWCLENAVEYLIANNDLHKTHEMNKSSTDDFSYTKFGIDRLQEIFESTMWPNMDYKTMARPQLEPSNNNTTTTTTTKKEENEDDDDDNIDTSSYPEHVQESFDKVKLFLEKGRLSALNNPVNNNSNSGEVEEDDDVDDDIQGLEKAFKELNSLREVLKDLPDSDRRDLAAKVALMFAQSMDE